MKVKGWTLYEHPCFADQLEALTDEVERLKTKNPATYRNKNATKRLAVIEKLILEDIPADPGAEKFRQGKTLGIGHSHWRRATFYQQYRLFFRYDTQARVIVYAWVNDEDTKRAYDSRTDAYAVFKKMLAGGNPPDDFDALKKAAKQKSK